MLNTKSDLPNQSTFYKTPKWSVLHWYIRQHHPCFQGVYRLVKTIQGITLKGHRATRVWERSALVLNGFSLPQDKMAAPKKRICKPCKSWSPLTCPVSPLRLSIAVSLYPTTTYDYSSPNTSRPLRMLLQLPGTPCPSHFPPPYLVHSSNEWMINQRCLRKGMKD